MGKCFGGYSLAECPLIDRMILLDSLPCMIAGNLEKERMGTGDVKQVEERAGKYLTFVLAGEVYGLEILKVREIIGMLTITRVPHTPPYVKGVINLRGKVIPVIDLRLKFEMPAGEVTQQTCIIVVNVGGVETGILVDKVFEVMDIAGEAIEDAPSLGAEVDTDYILGIGKAYEKVTLLLDIDKVISTESLRNTVDQGQNLVTTEARTDERAA